MINTELFFNKLYENDIRFFTGVPDSLLADFCAFISDNVIIEDHIIGVNEGNALSIAVGYNLATNKIPLVYLQNSGIGNLVNPLISICDDKVYGIPSLIVIGWRGEPGIKDEPQHIRQGEINEDMLVALKIKYFILSANSNYETVIKDALEEIKKTNKPCVILVRKDTFTNYKQQVPAISAFEMTREKAIENILEYIDDSNEVIVSTTGKASREVFEFRKNNLQGHHKDFLTVGGMGHASSIAFGIALKKPEKNVYCIDGDGAFLMHMGAISIFGQSKIKNFKHIILNNGSHESVGGQPTVALEINLPIIAKSCGYTFAETCYSEADLKNNLKLLMEHKGVALLEIKINNGSRKDLIRPDKSPSENKISFQKFLNLK